MKSTGDDPAPDRRRWSRRGFLGRLGGAALALLSGPAVAALTGWRRSSPGSDLTESDLLIASVAAPFASSNPRDARRIAEWVDGQLPPTRRSRDAGARAALARARLLHPALIAGELERDEVMVLDGWVLARSEAAAAIYLHTLTSEQGRTA